MTKVMTIFHQCRYFKKFLAKTFEKFLIVVILFNSEAPNGVLENSCTSFAADKHFRNLKFKNIIF